MSQVINLIATPNCQLVATNIPPNKPFFAWIPAIAGLGLVAAAIPFSVGNAPANAQSRPQVTPQPLQLAQVNQPTYTVLVVNPKMGNDDTANGTNQAPFRTITRALQVALPNSVIFLAPGTYSTETGEVFPLILKPGVTIQGNSQTRGQNVLIRGAGSYLSRTFARQSVAILGANQAALIGVTVTNPDSQGYGVWIESTSPVISDNTFTGSGHDGVSVVGNSAPLVRNNYFYQNGANGITIYGTSRPEVRENIFEQTGFAINTNQDAAPLIVGNRITQNRDGVVAQARSQPILRNNSIEGNEEDGVVAIAEARPNLGTAAEPGGNLFRNNRQFDVNTKRSSQTIPAFGNEIATMQGSLDLAGVSQPIAMTGGSRTPTSAPATQALVPVQTASSFQTALRSGSVASTQSSADPLPPASTRASSSNPDAGSDISAASFPTPALQPASATQAIAPAATELPAAASAGAASNRFSIQTVQFQSAPQAGSVARSGFVPTPVAQRNAANPVLIPVPSPGTKTAIAPNRSATLPVPTMRTTGATAASSIEIPVPPPETGPVASSGAASYPTPPQPNFSGQNPVAAAPSLLPVPSGNVPIGNVGSMPTVNVYRNPRQRDTSNPPALSTRPGATGLRYRVVVLATDETQQEQVRTVVPNAFRTFLNGRMVIQVGAFGDRAKASELAQTLINRGISATVEQL